MTDLTEELKRCPFCGGKAHVKKDYVECTTCGVFIVQTSFGKGDGIHQVINRWNARQHILDGMNMDELIQHFKNLEEDETLKRIDDAYNRGWYDAMNNPEINKALERLKPKKVINIQKNAFEEHFGNCPTCNDVVNDYVDKHYCRLCGQALDWSKE